MKKPRNLVALVNDDIITLSTIPLPTLLDWIQYCESWVERDMLGCEIMYRKLLGGNHD